MSIYRVRQNFCTTGLHVTTALYYPQMRPIICHGQRGQSLLFHFFFFNFPGQRHWAAKPQWDLVEGKIKKTPISSKSLKTLCIWLPVEGGQVLERWKKSEPGKVRFLLARTASKKFFSVDLLVCARSHLSAHSVHAALQHFKFAEFLAIPIGAGGDTPRREVVPAGRLHPLALKMLFGYPWWLTEILNSPSWMVLRSRSFIPVPQLWSSEQCPGFWGLDLPLCSWLRPIFTALTTVKFSLNTVLVLDL